MGCVINTFIWNITLISYLFLRYLTEQYIWLWFFFWFQTGESPLSIAEQLGYISVVEILKKVTEVVVTTSTTSKYRMMSPEMMQEAAMSDEEDDGQL